MTRSSGERVQVPLVPVGRLSSWGPACPLNAEVSTVSGPLWWGRQGASGPCPRSPPGRKLLVLVCERCSIFEITVHRKKR